MRSALRILVVAGAAVVLGGGTSYAEGEGYISPWIAANASSGVTNYNAGRAGFGFDAGGIWNGIVGAELDFGYSPTFFGTTNDFGHNTLINLMPNLIVAVPIGGVGGASIRPFVTGGAGWLRTQIDRGLLSNVSNVNNEWGWDAGGGVMAYFNDHVGIRGEVRYIRGFENLATGTQALDLSGANQLHFWRTGIGVVIR